MPYKNIEKQKEFQRTHYKNNKNLFIARTKKRRLSNLKIVINFKKQNPCACGESDVACLDLHHNNPDIKDGDISDGIRNWSKIRLEKEMLKCVVVCSNCHRKHHRDFRIDVECKNIKRKRNREFIKIYKESHPCTCGEYDVACLDFHHIRDKEIEISRAVLDYGLKRLKEEVLKCIVICSNCHRKHHYKEKIIRD